jgi:hypothetical protein
VGANAPILSAAKCRLNRVSTIVAYNDGGVHRDYGADEPDRAANPGTPGWRVRTFQKAKIEKL